MTLNSLLLMGLTDKCTEYQPLGICPINAMNCMAKPRLPLTSAFHYRQGVRWLVAKYDEMLEKAVKEPTSVNFVCC